MRLLIDRADKSEIELFMSMINAGEVFYNSAWKWGDTRAEEILADLRAMPIRLISSSDREVMAAARLRVKRGIFYADGFAACLAIRLECPLVTGDRDFQAHKSGGLLRLEWVGA